MEVAAVDARIEQITVYATGARVRRVMTIPAPLPSRVRIVGLPLSVIDDTVRVEVGGPAIATAVRAGVDAPVASDAAAEDTPELRAARRRVSIADAEVERITVALGVIAAATVVAPDPSDDPPAAWSLVVEARRSLVAFRAARELTLREQLVTARRELAEAQRALDAAVDRDRRSGTARGAKLHELRKYVEVELTATAASEIAIHLEYHVDAARWAPSYVARIEGEQVMVEVRAVVAQDAGEDWTGVPLKLSTAEPERFSLLPELTAQKIGRRQQEPARPGFRAPPTGADALYADYVRTLKPQHIEDARVFGSKSVLEDSTFEGARPGAPLPPPSFAQPQQQTFGELAQENWDDESSHAKESFSTPPSGVPVRMSVPAPKKSMSRGGGGDLGDRRDEAPGELPPAPVQAVPRLDYGNLRMAPASSSARGTLIAATADRHAGAVAQELASARARLAALTLPPGCLAAWAHTYDYAFTTDGAVDVRADGAWHSIAVTQKPSAAKLRHVTVPREQADVFRVAAITNPFVGPLLPGPIDVYDRGRFLVTSTVEYTPPGAPVEIGLGVDAAVKVARNVEFHEEAAGMLRGALRLVHAITIDVDNLSGRAIELEVRERLPVKRDGDDEVEITAGKIEPAWERWTPDAGAPREQRLRGGHRWKLTVPAGAKRTLRAAYEIKIAGKLELVGGNRRDA
ncbi:MAG: hypothetical protein JWP01_3279 [Myxococcales bacterium]|nr:hypothetical protein [Myxococcales bacterium]